MQADACKDKEIDYWTIYYLLFNARANDRRGNENEAEEFGRTCY